MSNLSNLFSSFFTEKITNPQEQIPIEKAETSDLMIGQASYDSLPYFDFDSWQFLTTKGKQLSLAEFRRLAKSLYLEEEIADYIDHAVRTNSLASKAYTDHLTMSDTDLVIDLKFANKTKEESIDIFNNEFQTEICALYSNCTSIRDISRLRLGHLFRYGVFASQKLFDKRGKLSEIRILPPHNLYWKYNDNHFIPYQKTRDRGEILINPKGFLYLPLFPLENDKGKFFIPPLLAGILHIPTYELFTQSISNNAVNLGFHKLLKLSPDYEAFNFLKDYNQTAKINNKSPIDYFFQIATDLSTAIKNSLKFAVLPLSFGLKAEEGQAIEPPRDLQSFENLITRQMIIGFKTYENIIGAPSQLNQTTLSAMQQKVYKNFIETPQACDTSAIKHDLIAWCTSNNLILESFNIYHEPPPFDSEIQEQAARAQRLKNDVLELQLTQQRSL